MTVKEEMSSATNRRAVVSRHGGPDVLQVVEEDLPEPLAGEARVQVTFADGSTAEYPGNRLDARLSAEIFSRSGRIARIQVGIPEEVLHEQRAEPVTGPQD